MNNITCKQNYCICFIELITIIHIYIQTYWFNTIYSRIIDILKNTVCDLMDIIEG